MGHQIRRANSGDAEFLAWVTLSASRGDLARGLWDLIVGADEAGCLDFLRRLAIAEPRSLYHYDSILIAEVDKCGILSTYCSHLDGVHASRYRSGFYHRER
jgi:hypothetical protein